MKFENENLDDILGLFGYTTNLQNWGLSRFAKIDISKRQWLKQETIKQKIIKEQKMQKRKTKKDFKDTLEILRYSERYKIPLKRNNFTVGKEVRNE